MESKQNHYQTNRYSRPPFLGHPLSSLQSLQGEEGLLGGIHGGPPRAGRRGNRKKSTYKIYCVLEVGFAIGPGGGGPAAARGLSSHLGRPAVHPLGPRARTRRTRGKGVRAPREETIQKYPHGLADSLFSVKLLKFESTRFARPRSGRPGPHAESPERCGACRGRDPAPVGWTLFVVRVVAFVRLLTGNGCMCLC